MDLEGHKGYGRSRVPHRSVGPSQVFASIPLFICKQATVLIHGHGHAGVDLSVLNNLMYREPVLVTQVGASGGFEPDRRPTTYKRALQLIEEGCMQLPPSSPILQ